MAPPVSAQKPPTGFSFVMRMPMVLTMRQPPDSVPSPIAAWHASTTHSGTWNVAAEHAVGVEQHGDDAHRLLRVVAAVAEGVERRRDELPAAEPARRPVPGVKRRKIQNTATMKHEAEDEAEQRREDDGHGDLGEAGPVEHAGARLGDARRRRARRSARARSSTGMPNHQVIRFQTIAPMSAANTTRRDRSRAGRRRPCRSWSATCVSKIRNATKLKNAAQSTA